MMMRLLGFIFFQCNICGKKNLIQIKKLSREIPSCKSCGSTVRMRGLIHNLSLALFNQSIPLNHFPLDKKILGIGMSDWEGYANLLENKVSYKNTFYHKEPRLDITNIPRDWEGSFDFLISADVFEHIEAPVSRAFENIKKLLKPNGAFVLTVPYTKEGDTTLEHFPELFNYKILNDENKRYYLENITKDGVKQIYKNLIFHGGPGTTLEMRVFCENSLILELRNAGFSDIRILSEPIWKYGIYQQENWSLPILAR